MSRATCNTHNAGVTKSNSRSVSTYNQVFLYTDRIEPLTGDERGGCAEVGSVKLDVVGPLLPLPQTPCCPPAVVVQHRSLVVVLPDLHAQHAALTAHWEKQKQTGEGQLCYSSI